jgi:hypothetical protein
MMFRWRSGLGLVSRIRVPRYVAVCLQWPIHAANRGRFASRAVCDRTLSPGEEKRPYLKVESLPFQQDRIAIITLVGEMPVRFVQDHRGLAM